MLERALASLQREFEDKDARRLAREKKKNQAARKPAEHHIEPLPVFEGSPEDAATWANATLYHVAHGRYGRTPVLLFNNMVSVLRVVTPHDAKFYGFSIGLMDLYLVLCATVTARLEGKGEKPNDALQNPDDIFPLAKPESGEYEPIPFLDLVLRHGLEAYFPWLTLGLGTRRRIIERTARRKRARKIPTVWGDDARVLALYDSVAHKASQITNSILYEPGTAPYLASCFASVLDAVSGYLEKEGSSLSKLLLTGIRSHGHSLLHSVNLQPRSPLYAWNERLPLNRTFKVVLEGEGGRNRYTLSRYDCVCTRSTAVDANARKIISFIMKRMDWRLRERLAYRPVKAPADLCETLTYGRQSVVTPAVADRILDEEFTMVVDTAVDAFYDRNPFPVSALPPLKTGKKAKAKPDPDGAPIEPVKVAVDFSQLDDIRAAADRTRDRLLLGLEEEMADKPTTQPIIQPYQPFQSASSAYGSDAYEEDDGMRALVRMMTPGEREAARLVLESPAACMDALKQLAIQEHAGMPEALFERVNNKALEQIGDVLVESEGGAFAFVEDYRQEFREALTK